MTFASPRSLSLSLSVGILTAAVLSLIIVFPLFRLSATGRSNGMDGGTGTVQRGERLLLYCGCRNARRTPRKKENNAVREGRAG